MQRNVSEKGSGKRAPNKAHLVEVLRASILTPERLNPLLDGIAGGKRRRSALIHCSKVPVEVCPLATVPWRARCADAADALDATASYAPARSLYSLRFAERRK